MTVVCSPRPDPSMNSHSIYLSNSMDTVFIEKGERTGMMTSSDQREGLTQESRGEESELTDDVVTETCALGSPWHSIVYMDYPRPPASNFVGIQQTTFLALSC